MEYKVHFTGLVLFFIDKWYRLKPTPKLKGSEYYGIRSIVSDKYRYIWNLTPEVEFLNLINNTKDIESSKWDIQWYQSWVEKAEEDTFALNLITKFRSRPKEELYDVVNDKWCSNNLADNPKYAEIKSELRKELLKWMEKCGDRGQETELKAFEHMPGHN